MEKEVTIYDIASLFNFSSTTVSRPLRHGPVVSKKTRKKIFEAAKKMNYRSNHFARKLRSSKTEAIVPGIRIPEDIAFVGFNNGLVSKVIEPNLTTINYPGCEMGEMCAPILINHLTGVSTIDSTDTIILRSEFIIRESSQKKMKGIK